MRVFVNVPLSDLSPGTYQWLRVSLSYQNYDIAAGRGHPAGSHAGLLHRLQHLHQLLSW